MRTLILTLVLASAFFSVGCATAPETKRERTDLVVQAKATMAKFKKEKPGYHKAYNGSAKGVAIFPSIGKGGYFLGGAYGQGVVLQNGKVVGYCKIEQLTAGFQLGGQAYSQIIFFGTKDALSSFKQGEIAGAAAASAVAIKADAAATANYSNGVASFAFDSSGAMYEATVGGQKFSFIAKETFE